MCTAMSSGLTPEKLLISACLAHRLICRYATANVTLDRAMLGEFLNLYQSVMSDP